MTTGLKDKVAFVTGAARRIGRAIALWPWRETGISRRCGPASGTLPRRATIDRASAGRATTKPYLPRTRRGLGAKAFTVAVDVADRARSRLQHDPPAKRSASRYPGERGRNGEQHCDDRRCRSTAGGRNSQSISPGPLIVSRSWCLRWSRRVGAGSSTSRRRCGAAGAWPGGLLGEQGRTAWATRSVAQEFGRSGITCNAILPGLIGTPLVRSMPAHLRDSIVASTPVGRLGEPSDIGHLAAFLASQQASFISAVGIPCDGGYSNAPLRGLNN